MYTCFQPLQEFYFVPFINIIGAFYIDLHIMHAATWNASKYNILDIYIYIGIENEREKHKIIKTKNSLDIVTNLHVIIEYIPMYFVNINDMMIWILINANVEKRQNVGHSCYWTTSIFCSCRLNLVSISLRYWEKKSQTFHINVSLDHKSFRMRSISHIMIKASKISLDQVHPSILN